MFFNLNKNSVFHHYTTRSWNEFIWCISSILKKKEQTENTQENYWNKDKFLKLFSDVCVLVCSKLQHAMYFLLESHQKSLSHCFGIKSRLQKEISQVASGSTFTRKPFVIDPHKRATSLPFFISSFVFFLNHHFKLTVLIQPFKVWSVGKRGGWHYDDSTCYILGAIRLRQSIPNLSTTCYPINKCP